MNINEGMAFYFNGTMMAQVKHSLIEKIYE